MSLILEALRKSEAQRRLGQAPDLLSPMPGVARTARRWRRGAGYVAALLAVAAIAWWSGQRRAMPPAASAAIEAAAPRATPASDAIAPASPTPVRAAERAMPRLAPGDASAPTAHSMARAATPATATPATPPNAAALPAAVAPLAVAAAPMPVAAPSLPTLAELSLTERQSLPPLRVTMHVYADAALRRFAIIDGQRVGEGALLGAGVVVAEIARDGVVLDVHGRRIWLPRP